MGFPGDKVGKESACQIQSLEKEMATHWNIPTWGTPWTEAPGGLQSMESQELRMIEQRTPSHALCRS